MLVTLGIYVLCLDLRTNSCFPYTSLTDWFFMAEKEFVYYAVRTEALFVIQCNFHVETFSCLLIDLNFHASLRHSHQTTHK
jgi:hypothetical protein